MRLLLGTAYLGYKGWAAAEVTTILHPALALATSLARHEALLVIYWGLFWNVLTPGRVADALPWAQQMLAAGETSGDSIC